MDAPVALALRADTVLLASAAPVPGRATRLFAHAPLASSLTRLRADVHHVLMLTRPTVLVLAAPAFTRRCASAPRALVPTLLIATVLFVADFNGMSWKVNYDIRPVAPTQTRMR
mmetsp:Transcript_6753/g.14997  ORF Transcript_6753/g.14997 Transcript_6753/m.14997 type:complete len:114 (-) Transcript_6753:110-451(-)